MRFRHSRFLVVAFIVLCVLSCRGKKNAISVTDPDATAPPKGKGDEKGLVIRLSHADPDAANAPRPKLAEATKLSDADVKQVLKRLPKLDADPDDTKEFALRESSLPPPKTGGTVLAAFPPKSGAKPPTAKTTGPLEVVRFAPEGAVPLAPHLSVTFNHPMVPVTSLDELAAEDVPVELTPTPKGKWRWIGTKTLLFEPEPAGRFPMATKYAVSVKAGTKSQVGTTVKTAKSWGFTTPAPTVESFHPQGGPTRLQPLMIAVFDQKVDAKAVAATISVQVGRKARKVRLASKDEIEADDVVRQLSTQAEDGRWVAFVPAGPLPPDARVQVEIGPGTPSAEGPRKTEKAQRYEFRTFGPMKVTDHRCGYDGRCDPGMPFEIVFSNPVKQKTFDAAMVKVEPELPNQSHAGGGWDVQIYGNMMYVTGKTKGRTAYKVTLDASLPDEFGQRLGKDDTLRFKVGEAPESLFAQGTGLVVLDPAVGPRFSVFSVNHDKLKVQAYAVSPDDWTAYLKTIERVNNDPRDLAVPGKRVLDETIAPKGAADETVETVIDLSKALKKGLGHVVLVVEPTKQPKDPWRYQRVLAWVQATKIGVQAHVDDEEMLVWATALADGKPLAKAKIELRPGGVTATTDAHGLATVALPSKSAQVVVVRSGDDVAFLPESIWWWNEEGGSWRKTTRKDELRWYVFDDRHLYRPGEEVHVKGWLRRNDPGKGGDLGALAGMVRDVDYVLRDSQGNKVKSGSLTLNTFGAFDTTLTLPKTMNLGGASFELSARTKAKDTPGAQYWHSFEVQEFRRPEYEVTTALSEGPHLVASHAIATVNAKYYAGGALPNADVTWFVTSAPGFFQPPGNEGWIFGKWEPWWMFWRHWGGHEPDPADVPKSQTFAARTDASGEHRLKMDFVSVDPPRAMAVSAQATVMDVNRQAWTSTTSTVVHSADVYVGLKTDRAFVQAGESIELDAIAVDIDGKRKAGAAIHVRAARIEMKQEKGEYVEKELDAQTCDKKSAADSVRCTITTKEGGSHRIVAVVTDGKGRTNRTEMTMWVAGGELPAPRDVAQEQVLLIPDRETYAAGQTAKIAVAAPWPDAEGLVTLRRSGIVEARHVKLDGTSTTIDVPITDAMTPQLTVQIDLVGAAPRRDENGKVDPKLAKRPAFATGNATLAIPPLARKLAIEVKPAAAKVEPGAKTHIDLVVKDASGKAVDDAEVALVVVDESVLALTGYVLPDPLAMFYGWRDPGVRDHHLRTNVLLAKPTDVAQEGGDAGGGRSRGAVATGTAAREESDNAAPGAPPPPAEPAPAKQATKNKPQAEFKADEKPAGGESTPIAMRTDFDALALFSPSVRTDKSGRASVPVELPDSLTRYRIMAVAVAGERQFGTGESTITARLPLMVRPSAPRFLNFGDELELPVVVQNQTDDPMTVDVAVRTANLELADGAGRRVKVPANDRVEVRFPAKAAWAGTARAQIGAASGKWADAASFELPVWTPATTEAFATYGEVDKGAITQPVRAPAGVFPQFGGLEITTSSTALQALTDAVLYLVAYPFECSEQIASRVLAIAALKDVLAAFEAEGLPAPKQLIAAVDRDIEKLRRMQTDDGGFSFWGRGWPAWPYLTVHVLHALERARDEGFKVPKETLDRARAYVREIEKHLDPDWPIECRWAIRAYALYVLDVAGEPNVRKAQKLFDEAGIDKLGLEGLAWLLPTFGGDTGSAKIVEKIRRHFDNRVSETAAAAHFTTSYTDGQYLLLHSDRRADALILEALVQVDPKSDLIPKLVRGLLGHRKAGRWSSTQENGFVLVALDRYFETFEKQTPDFVARAWLGKGYAGDHRYRGRTTESHQIEVPMAFLAAAGKGDQDLVLAKEGKGRMYYRIGMRYAPRDLTLPPYDAGFVVERSYESIDDPKDVRRDKDGTWRIKAGARVRVRLKMVAEARRYHVALVDPLPAGLEAQNPVLATTGALPPNPKDPTDTSTKSGFGDYWWWWRPWYEHQNMRDERVEAFTSLLWEGVHDFDYIARATTPGRFVVPPPKAEEMYHPETFGRGAGDIVVVE